ncbi:HD-GYP domain-containing protein [Paenibacillus nasutitermitis]|uniref:HD-GYP domain-containing protein n=1 Tax=Paenibacillus nasutitermitis TaxID=1652958 RepID=A0A916ZEH9_9BACL|nr:HD domain-containing phosphohydrolase [Paenibacillus nasutitermitis]GGD91171.1 hypothetical protein GCM10010911_57330 [Paenibacillus nasutitermitis]
MNIKKLMAMPVQQMILLLVGGMASMAALFGIIDAVYSRSFDSKEMIMISLAVAILAWSMFDFQKKLTLYITFSKLIVVSFLFLIMVAGSIYNPMLPGQMWVMLLIFPVLSSLLVHPRVYGYCSIIFLLYVIVYMAFGEADQGVEGDAGALFAALRILFVFGSVLLGGIIIIARHQQKKQHEERAFQQQKQQVIHMLQCFIPVGERKTQTSRQEISEMSLLLKALWTEHGGQSSKDWEIDLLSLLHFVSRVKLPDYMFEKEGKLSEFELEVVQEHCFMAKELCEDVPGFLEVQHAFLYHHEKINGTGYPYRLKEDQIPTLSQMLGLVEVFLAMTTPRSYRKAMTEREAYEEIRKLAGTSFREDIVQAFGRVIG